MTEPLTTRCDLSVPAWLPSDMKVSVEVTQVSVMQVTRGVRVASGNRLCGAAPGRFRQSRMNLGRRGALQVSAAREGELGHARGGAE
jgi:hypothetical protein